jgi:hypothetical protein
VLTRNSLLRRLLTSVLAAAVVLPVLPYAWAPVYRFDDPKPFTGSRLFNPYAKLIGRWQRANLHAHGRAWSGLTNGRQADDEVATRYRQLGYDVPGVSDYQRIAALNGVATLPLYEHGFNIGKHHQLAIGARTVTWFDFPLWQSTSQQQYVIDRVARTADLVALAHPDSRFAYSLENLQQLTGYQLIEVANGPFASEESWDAVLSSGHPVWGLGNDDTHDLDDPRRTAGAWNMIDAASPTTADIVAALRAGRSYAVLRTGAVDSANVTVLAGVDVRDDTVTVTCTGAASTISFIGQNGAVRHTVKDANTAAYTLSGGDTYVRTVIESPQTVLYLNPVIRYDGSALPAPAASIDIAGTWVIRISFVLGCAALAAISTRRRRPRPARAAAVLADAKEKSA